jgi:hypothetical protein
VLRERRALRRARHVMAAAKELGLRPAARSKAGVSVKGHSSEMDRCVFRVRAAGIGRRGHLQSLDPSRVALLESRSSTTITSAIVVSRLVPLVELRRFQGVPADASAECFLLRRSRLQGRNRAEEDEEEKPTRRAMERCEARAPRDGARRPWRLTDRQLRHIVRRAGQSGSSCWCPRCAVAWRGHTPPATRKEAAWLLAAAEVQLRCG